MFLLENLWLTRRFRKALQYACSPGLCNIDTQRVDTIRLLAQAQEHFSASDVIKCAERYFGPPLGVELLLSRELEDDADDAAQSSASGSDHIFATALRHFGAGNRAWEALIRKLIRKAVDVHSRVNQYRINYYDLNAPFVYGPSDARDSWIYGTPLDELFAERFKNPAAGCRASADAWLQILSSEGFDVQAYLKEEVAIHAAQTQLTWISDLVPELCRQLCFETGENPCVWWEWQPHPLSRILLAQTEYRQITLNLDGRKLGMDFPVPWQDRWPFDRPEWSNDPRMWQHDDQSPTMSWNLDGWKRAPECRRVKRSPERERLNRLAQERADRRFAKKYRKLRQTQEGGITSLMPGSWPECSF